MCGYLLHVHWLSEPIFHLPSQPSEPIRHDRWCVSVGLLCGSRLLGSRHTTQYPEPQSLLFLSIQCPGCCLLFQWASVGSFWKEFIRTSLVLISSYMRLMGWWNNDRGWGDIVLYKLFSKRQKLTFQKNVINYDKVSNVANSNLLCRDIIHNIASRTHFPCHSFLSGCHNLEPGSSLLPSVCLCGCHHTHTEPHHWTAPLCSAVCMLCMQYWIQE